SEPTRVVAPPADTNSIALLDDPPLPPPMNSVRDPIVAAAASCTAAGSWPTALPLTLDVRMIAADEASAWSRPPMTSARFDAIGALVVWLALRARLQHERESAAERLALLEDARERLSDSFKALAGEALNSNNKAFVDLAKAELAQHQLQAREELEKRKVAIDG